VAAVLIENRAAGGEKHSCHLISVEGEANVQRSSIVVTLDQLGNA
jgi:hypothetical protein